MNPTLLTIFLSIIAFRLSILTIWIEILVLLASSSRLSIYRRLKGKAIWILSHYSWDIYLAICTEDTVISLIPSYLAQRATSKDWDVFQWGHKFFWRLSDLSSINFKLFLHLCSSRRSVGLIISFRYDMINNAKLIITIKEIGFIKQLLANEFTNYHMTSSLYFNPTHWTKCQNLLGLWALPPIRG